MTAAASSSSSSSSTTTAPKFADQKRHAVSVFLAQDETVTIVPNFTYAKPIPLISRTSIGPLEAGMETPVPLWLALLLRKKSLCRIPPPAWMEVPRLRAILKQEKEQESFSHDLPYHALEMAHLLVADVPASSMILLHDIFAVRQDKIRKNLHTLAEQALSRPEPLPVVDVTGIAALEVARIAPFCETAFRHHLMLLSKGVTKASANKPVDSISRSTAGNGQKLGGKDEETDQPDDGTLVDDNAVVVGDDNDVDDNDDENIDNNNQDEQSLAAPATSRVRRRFR